MNLNGPAPLKKGSKWTPPEIDAFRRWCSREQQRRYILLTTHLAVLRRGYDVSLDNIEYLWSVFISKLHIRLQGYDPRAGRSALTYLIEGCAQFVIDRKRRDGRRDELLRSLSTEQRSRFMRSGSSTTELEIIRRIDLQKICDVLESELPFAEADVIRKHYLEGRSLKNIAAKQGESLGAVKTRLYRARKRLREIFVSDHRRERRMR